MFVIGVGGWPLGHSHPNLCRGFSAWESVRCALRILRCIGTCSATGDGQLAANTTLSSFFKEVGPRHGGSLTPPMAAILVDARWSLQAPPFTFRSSSRRRKNRRVRKTQIALGKVNAKMVAASNSRILHLQQRLPTEVEALQTTKNCDHTIQSNVLGG